MRKLLFTVITVIVPFAAATAQDVSRRSPSPPKPKSTEVAPVKAKPVENPAGAPAPRRSILDRIFGPRVKPTPPPEPTPTPAPKVKSKPRSKPRPVEPAEKPEEAVDSKPNPSAAPDAKPEDTNPPPPKPENTEPSPGATPPAPGAKPPTDANPAETEAQPPKTTGKKGSKKPVKPDGPALDDVTKYKNAKATASEDAAIKELKTKADNAVQESEAHAASVAYNRALFRKVRQIDPSLDKYVDGIEAAMMKRLNAEKKGE